MRQLASARVRKEQGHDSWSPQCPHAANMYFSSLKFFAAIDKGKSPTVVDFPQRETLGSVQRPVLCPNSRTNSTPRDWKHSKAVFSEN